MLTLLKIDKYILASIVWHFIDRLFFLYFLKAKKKIFTAGLPFSFLFIVNNEVQPSRGIVQDIDVAQSQCFLKCFSRISLWWSLWLSHCEDEAKMFVRNRNQITFQKKSSSLLSLFQATSTPLHSNFHLSSKPCFSLF